MKPIAWGMLAATLAFASSCARRDWIEQTLVTVDVTGTWQGSVAFSRDNVLYEFTLTQHGPKVDGVVRQEGRWSIPAQPPDSGPLAGSVAGDVFSFRRTTGDLKGEMTVSGDEMTGTVTVPVGPHILTLRRVDSPSRPKSKEP